MIQGNSRQVEIIFIALTNSGTYSNNIIIFIMWLFNKRSAFLVQESIPEIEAMNREDLLYFQRREEDENMTNRGK